MLTTIGVDTPQQISVHEAATLYKSGVRFVGRYYSQSLWKRLFPAEARVLKKAGLYTVVFYEDAPTTPGYFSTARGEADATRATTQARENGQPEKTPIYMTVDYDAGEYDLPAITNYAKTAAHVLREEGYKAGWYGSGLVLRTVLNAWAADYLALAESTGWAGHAAFLASGDWDIHQLLATTRDGISVDADKSNGHAGGWMTTLEG